MVLTEFRKIDLSPFLNKEDEIISTSLDNDGLSVLVIHNTPEYRSKDGTHSIVQRETPNTYTFFRFNLEGDLYFSSEPISEKFNIHFAALLPYDEILLVSGRCRRRSDLDFDRNARVYGIDGKLKRAFSLGDGIQDVRVDRQGQIWTSYFDEGIFGNYGWDYPIGAPGLICWTNLGESTWEFEPVDGLNDMADCYAMNIDDDGNVWFYYYTEFPLVKLSPDKQISYWESGISGSHSVHISGNRILMGGGYNSDDFALFEIDGKQMKRVSTVQFQAEGKTFGKRELISGDGRNIAFLDEKTVWICQF